MPLPSVCLLAWHRPTNGDCWKLYSLPSPSSFHVIPPPLSFCKQFSRGSGYFVCTQAKGVQTRSPENEQEEYDAEQERGKKDAGVCKWAKKRTGVGKMNKRKTKVRCPPLFSDPSLFFFFFGVIDLPLARVSVEAFPWGFWASLYEDVHLQQWRQHLKDD